MVVDFDSFIIKMSAESLFTCVIQGRYVSGSISNFSTESCSNLNQTTSIINADKGINSGTTELNEPYYSPGSTEEVSSKFVLENFEANHNNLLDRLENPDKKSQPEVNQALRNLAAQLSLDDDDDDDSIYFREALPVYSTQNESTLGLGHLHYEQTEFSQAHENLLQGLELRGHGEINEAEKQQSYATTQLPKVLGTFIYQSIVGCPSHILICCEVVSVLQILLLFLINGFMLLEILGSEEQRYISNSNESAFLPAGIFLST